MLTHSIIYCQASFKVVLRTVLLSFLLYFFRFESEMIPAILPKYLRQDMFLISFLTLGEEVIL